MLNASISENSNRDYKAINRYEAIKALCRFFFSVGAAVLLVLPTTRGLQTQDLAVVGAAGQASTVRNGEDQRTRYTVQQQDVLSINFPLSPELNQTLTIQPDGFINLQSAGSIHVQGLTVPQIVVAVSQAYTGILHNPIVNVDLQDFQKPFYTVSGQVGKPGQYELRADITLQQALAVAGGMTLNTAKTQIFLFRRTPDGTMYEVKMVNMKEILRGKRLKEDLTVKSNDIVYVPEKFIANFKKYVPYQVNLGTYLQAYQ